MLNDILRIVELDFALLLFPPLALRVLTQFAQTKRLSHDLLLRLELIALATVK